MSLKITAFCDHISTNHVHCNRYVRAKLDDPNNVEKALEEKGWEVEGDETYCGDHH